MESRPSCRRARRRSGTILGREDRRYLISAAYLHDIGYAPDLSELACISSMAAFKDRVLKSNNDTERARSSMRCDKRRHICWVPSNGQRTGCGNAGGKLGQAMTVRGRRSR